MLYPIQEAERKLTKNHASSLVDRLYTVKLDDCSLKNVLNYIKIVICLVTQRRPKENQNEKKIKHKKDPHIKKKE